MKKIIGFGICMLLMTLVLPSSVANVDPPVKTKENFEINISAGFHGRNIGLGFAIDVLNHKTEVANVFFNFTFDYLIMNKLDGDYSMNFTADPEYPFTVYIMPIICRPDGIKFFSITVEADNTIVTRNGLSINRLVILYK